MLNEKLGKLNFWLHGDRVQPHVLPDALPRHRGSSPAAPTRTRTGMGWDTLNLIATIGAFIIALSRARVPRERHLHRGPRRGARADDPWDAPHARVDHLVAAARVQLRRDPGRRRTATSSGTASTPRTTKVGSVKLPPSDAVAQIPPRRDPSEPHSIHMPSPSYWPLVFALGLPIIGYGFVFKIWWLLAVGVVVMLFGINGWTLGARDRGDALMAQTEHVVTDAMPETLRRRSTARPRARRHEHRRQQQQARDLAVHRRRRRCSSARSSRRTSSTAAATRSS